MTSAAQRKGDTAEREIAKILSDQLGVTVRRKLGAGRMDDEGDIEGLADTCVEIKSYRDIVRGLNEGLNDSVREQANAGTTHGVAFIRRPGGRWFAALTVEQYCTLWREANS
jgi:hypothetical protein